MPKFEHGGSPAERAAVDREVKDLLRPDINWVFWSEFPAAGPKHVQPPSWPGWAEAAMPCPYRAGTRTERDWKHGYCYLWAGGPYWGDPYRTEAQRGLSYAWRHGWVVAMFSIEMSETGPTEVEVRRLLEQGVREGKWVRYFNRADGDWRYFAKHELARRGDGHGPAERHAEAQGARERKAETARRPRR